MHGKLRQITIGPLQTTQHLERDNLHMNRGGYLRCIDCVGIELESLFLFLLFREKCCCVGHGCILFFESSLIAKVTKWDLVGRLIQWDWPCCKKGERQFDFWAFPEDGQRVSYVGVCFVFRVDVWFSLQCQSRAIRLHVWL